MASEAGLRERKKRQTRELIAESARRLFLERGFDRVTVTDVARAADVSEATVFNYFPTKEDLAYYRMGDFEEEMLAAIRDRPPGSTITEAFGRFVLEPRGFLREEGYQGPSPEAITRMFTGSRALRARERALFERYERALAVLIADERGLAPDDAESRVIANALIGLHRALIEQVRSQVLAGVEPRRIARNISASGQRAFDSLNRGLAEIRS